MQRECGRLANHSAGGGICHETGGRNTRCACELRSATIILNPLTSCPGVVYIPNCACSSGDNDMSGVDVGVNMFLWVVFLLTEGCSDPRFTFTIPDTDIQLYAGFF